MRLVMVCLPVWAALGLTLACKGSMSADAKMGAELDGVEAEADAEGSASAEGEPAEHDRPLSRAESDRASRAFAPADQPVTDTLPLFGARHDVRVRSTEGAVPCRCVGALLGPPTMNQVQWQGAIPATKPETQLFLALAPESDCPGAPKGSQGGSYWGYRVSGKDVIVLLESWRPEGMKTPPPRTIAAIIPKPAEGGQVYLAPLNKKLPFGAAADGKGARCAIGNPGPRGAAVPAVSDSADADVEGVAD